MSNSFLLGGLAFLNFNIFPQSLCCQFKESMHITRMRVTVLLGVWGKGEEGHMQLSAFSAYSRLASEEASLHVIYCD